ncbi:divergent PAP2 family protein [Cyanobium sp. NS01]|uniref:divergent PAP2 family protein n=1 Tax=Cyanobium sp. NS01 TaxID=261284 RepID=UPI00351C6F59
MEMPLAALHDAQPLAALLANSTLWWGLVACGLAQASKLVIELVLHRRWRPAVLLETGGMPSSHSALLTGTTAALGWQQGFADPLFALAAALCFVVLYDASGVRRAAGLTAGRVNQLPEALWPPEPGSADADSSTLSPTPSRRPLKENLGHTRLEVLVGSLLGPAIALPGLVLLGSPLELAHAWGVWLGLG